MRRLRKISTLVGIQICATLYAQPSNGNYIVDSTIARYQFELKELTIAEIPEGSTLQDIDLLERNLLQYSYSHIRITEGINSSYQLFLQTEFLEGTMPESWMSTSKVGLITPSGSYGFNDNGERAFYFPHSDEERKAYTQATRKNSENGYQPLMMSFPELGDQWIAKIEAEGSAHVEALDNNALQCTWWNRSVLIEPSIHSITTVIEHDDLIETTVTLYSPFPPYGYVVTSELHQTVRTDIPNPLIIKTFREFSKHIITDSENKIPTIDDTPKIEIQPVPVKNEYRILLANASSVEVTKVEVRDFMGDLIRSYSHPEIQNGVIHLNAQSYPSGVLLVLLYTQNRIYSETITKS